MDAEEVTEDDRRIARAMLSAILWKVPLALDSDQVKLLATSIAWLRHNAVAPALEVKASFVAPHDDRTEPTTDGLELERISAKLVKDMLSLSSVYASKGAAVDAAFERVRDLERAACRKAWYRPEREQALAERVSELEAGIRVSLGAREQALAERVGELEAVIVRVREEHLDRPVAPAVLPESGLMSEFYAIYYSQACDQLKQASSALAAALPEPVEVALDD